MKKLIAIVLCLMLLLTVCQFAAFAEDYVDGRPNHMKLKTDTFTAGGVTVVEGLAGGNNPKSLTITFGSGGNATVTNDNGGCAAVTSDNTLKLTYHELWSGYGAFYGCGLAFPQTDETFDYAYARVEYKAKSAVETSLIFEAGDNRHFAAEHVTDTNGKFVLSETVALSQDMAYRFSHGLGGFLYASTAQTGDEYEIKAIYFFQTREEANELGEIKYVDGRPNHMKLKTDAFTAGGVTAAEGLAGGNNPSSLTASFGEGGNTTVTNDNGGCAAATSDNTLKLTYHELWSGYGVFYGCGLTFPQTDETFDYAYVRVEYKAKNAVETSLIFEAGDNRHFAQLSVTDTGDAFVLSETAALSQDMAYRFSHGIGGFLYASTNRTGDEYEIKAIYFFQTKEEADAFVPGAAAPAGELVEVDGELYYQENGVGVMAGLVKVGDDYYFAGYNGKIVKNKLQNIWANATGEDAFTGKNRVFGADGKLASGLVTVGDDVYYCVDGKPTMAGLVKDGDDVYFIGGEGKAIKNKIQNIWKNDSGDETFTGKNRAFGADGKLLTGILNDVYYKDGKATMAGLVEVDGDLYFASGAGRIVKDKVQYIWANSTDNADLTETNQTFGADGKLVA